MKLDDAFAIVFLETLGGPKYEGEEARRLLVEFYERSPSEEECDAVARLGIEVIARAAGLDPEAPTPDLLEALGLGDAMARVALRNAGKKGG